MKIGDLVTLSSRGKKLESCRHSRGWDVNKLVGLVLHIEERRWGVIEPQVVYKVRWQGKGPEGRMRWHCDHWYRCDLKYVSKVR